MYKQFNIRKSHGGKEEFSREKLYRSLKRSGLNPNRCDEIADKVCQEVHEGSKTRDIYRKALSLVKQDSPLAAVHYSLKRAIFELGPAGHNFELFVAKYFEELDFKTSTGKTVQGKFVSHEIDVIASNETQRFFTECKFHNKYGIKNDIKVALYVKARWDDVKEGPEGKNLNGFYLASNTSFSKDAITYAEGVGLRLLGVNAPKGVPFIEEVKKLKLYPVTSLKRINKHLMHDLLAKNVILAQEIPANLNILLQHGLSEAEIEDILNQVNILQDSV